MRGILAMLVTLWGLMFAWLDLAPPTAQAATSESPAPPGAPGGSQLVVSNPYRVGTRSGDFGRLAYLSIPNLDRKRLPKSYYGAQDFSSPGVPAWRHVHDERQADNRL